MEKLDYSKLRTEFLILLSNISRKEINEWVRFDSKRQKKEQEYARANRESKGV